MEEIRLWKVVPSGQQKVKVSQIEATGETTTEKLLEDVLTASPEILLPDLRLVGRQTETPGGPLDLLGVDGDGRLVVFELKRGSLTRDAVAQAIDYASFLASLEIADLCRHVSENSGRAGIEAIPDFAQWYQGHFQKSVEDIGRPRVVLVGLGADERAKRMVAFLAAAELDISLLTFHGFTHGSETLLAKHVEVQARQGLTTVRSTKRDNQAKLEQLLISLQMRDGYDAMVTALKSGLGTSTYQWPNAAGYSFYLQEVSATGGPTNRAYAALYVSEKQKDAVQLVLQPRAVELLGEDHVRTIAESLGTKATIKPTGLAELWVDVKKSSASQADALTNAGKLIAAGWKAKMDKQQHDDDEATSKSYDDESK